MKKLLAIGLVLAMLVAGAGVAVADNGVPSIAKSMSAVEADLGDHITVTLEGYGESGQKVVDTLPDELGYLGNFMVDGVGATPSVVGQVISYTLTTTGAYTITFDVQVTESPPPSDPPEDYVVTNDAEIRDALGVKLDDDDADLIIEPYDGFSKIVDDCTNDPWDDVPWKTDVHWLLLIEVENINTDSIGTMQNVVVKDRFGGDLELHDPYVEFTPPSSDGTYVTKETGCTKKVHLTWTEFGDLTAGADLSDGGDAQLYIEISTDVNPGPNTNKVGHGRKNGHQEYTETTGIDEYNYLNSGAVLKFTDSVTGLQLSAHTGRLAVTVYEPVI